MPKNAIIILGVVIVLIVGGIIVFNFVLQKEEITPGEQPVSEEEFSEENQEETGQSLSVSAVVSSIDVKNNFLMVKPENKEKEIKVFISEGTEMKKVGLPTDPEDMPKEGGPFVATEKAIGISDFREGDIVFIRTSTNLVGKTELNDVVFIQVLP